MPHTAVVGTVQFTGGTVGALTSLDILGLDLEVSVPVSHSGPSEAVVGQVAYGPVRFTVASGPSAVQFFRAVTTGQTFGSALVRLFAPDATDPYLILTATNVLPVETSTGDDGKGAGMLETVGFIAETQTLTAGAGPEPESSLADVGTLEIPSLTDVAISGSRVVLASTYDTGGTGGPSAGRVGTEGVEVTIPGSKQLVGLFDALKAKAPIEGITIDQSTSTTTPRTVQLAGAYITGLSISRDGTGMEDDSDVVTFAPREIRRTFGTATAAYDFREARLL